MLIGAGIVWQQDAAKPLTTDSQDATVAPKQGGDVKIPEEDMKR